MTTVAEVGVFLGIVKKILDLLPKSGADAKVVAELTGQMLELQRAAFDWENEKREFRLQVDELRERLRDKRRLVLRDNAYWDEETGEGPFCNGCWSGDRKVVPLHNHPDYGTWDCPVGGQDHRTTKPDRRVNV